MNTFCDYHYLICRNLAYQPSGKMRQFISMLPVPSLLLLFQTMRSSNELYWLNPRCKVGSRDSLFFQEKGRNNRSPSDNGRISPVLDKPADVQIITELMTSTYSESSVRSEGVDESVVGERIRKHFCSLSEAAAYRNMNSCFPPEQVNEFSSASLLTTTSSSPASYGPSRNTSLRLSISLHN